jgi:DNA-binding SARP family transcriptional activator
LSVDQTLIRFGVLGPLEVLADGQPVALGGPQQRGLLAVLLLDANRVVSQERLVSDLWGDDPPATARSLLHGCVAGLRRVLPPGPDGQRLVTRSPGYLLRVAPGELDVARFEALAASTGSGHSLEEAAATLRAALALWRGPALHDLPLEACRSAAARLDERRLVVLERRIDVDLRLGKFADVAIELGVLMREHPLRERLWAQLMLALYGSGRQADALAAFRTLRAGLVDELGIEPSALLQQVERSVLTGGDALAAYSREIGGPALELVPAASPGTPVPAQLPAAVSAFTGRAGELERLDGLLADVGSSAVAVVAGAAGVGKTALAVHWAHAVRDRFTGGQLYVDLRGHASTAPMTPFEALAGLLPALGVAPDRVPTDLDQAAALYRTMLADRRMVVVLDNAGSAEQVRPLLPGPGSVVVVTSRHRLGGLVARDGAIHIALDVLTPAEAFALLSRLLRRQRIHAAPAATGELAELCGFLPLALRAAAANLILQTTQPVAGHRHGGARTTDLTDHMAAS